MGERIHLRKHAREQLPSVSVLISAWNEEVGIRATLKSIVRTRYPHLEIVVVNDGSTDRTEEIVQQYISEYHTKYPEGRVAFRYAYVQNGG